MSDEFAEYLASKADVVIPGLERVGPLSTSEILATRDWYEARMRALGQEATDLKPREDESVDGFSIDPDEVAKRLRVEGYERVSIEPSAISGSPYRYVYVYMTDAEYEGYHAIISDLREYEENDGYLVGVYTHYEEGAYLIDAVPTFDEAVKLLRQWLDRMLADG